MRESTKVENTKTTKRSNSTNKSALNKGKKTSSCGSCGVCSRIRSPQISSKSASSALSYAKAIGKESCAVSFMQWNYGNRFTTGVLSQPSAVGGQPTIQKKCSCGGSCSKCKGEEEAEKISMSIMKMSKPSAINYQPSANNYEQTQISEIMSSKGSGHGLDDNTRSFMGDRFGYDFSHVRLHNDSFAARKSNELNAAAFTIGRDVFFNAGRYNPSSTSGRRLLTHELTHVVQQTHQSQIQRLIRTSLVTCPVGQNPYRADRRASTLLDNAINLIDSAIAERPANPAHADVVTVSNAMRTAFRLNPANNDHWTLAAPHFGLLLIRRRLEIARDYINSVVFTVNCIAAGANCMGPCVPEPCGAGTEACTCPDTPTTINVCPLFWARNLNQRGRVWAHEVFHINFGFIEDWTQPDRANAHCYAQFVALLNGFNSSAGFRCH
jgi:hypothetical protein